ncbi:MAG: phosphopyruvate hydratase [Candidatus Altiarchaeales archaeon]|nr:phosphopyruvate hydratase [Candidatus Altiarchaeales archaeon]MBD3415693.1 phosphopyruvate hydratase [Candidatus Altiarchaeales archaeon]
MKITGVHAREVLDSRGNPTVEVDLKTEKGRYKAMVPSGASTGSHEAVELRDGDKRRYNGKGVLKAVENVNKTVKDKVVGFEVADQRGLDELLNSLDGTENKGKLGANAILAVSMAACKAGADDAGKPLYAHIAELAGSEGVTLPVPQLNVINGGKHAGKENDIQENMYMPVGAKSFREGLRMGAETYHILKKMLKDRYGVHAVQLGDEGGFVPPIDTPRERLELMAKAAEEAGYGKDMAMALDPASSEYYYKDGGYYMIGDKRYEPGEMVDFYTDLVGTFPIVSIEDGMAEDDWSGWTELNSKLGDRIQLTGDDLLVTNVKRIEKAIEDKACNALLLKVNQIGSVTESIDAAKLSYDSGWAVTVSHRSGETEDSFIADLSVGIDSGQIKTGAPARSERLSKYNQLLRIEEELGSKAKYRGRDFRG